MTESSDRFRNFAARLLEYEGALVEGVNSEGPEVLEAMLPERLQRELQAPEFLRLGFGADAPRDAVRASLESDWLERLGGLLGAGGQRLKFVVQSALPSPGSAEREVERGVVLQNAVYRLSQVEPAWTRYLVFIFQFTAISDEKREGLVRFGFNVQNGSAVDPFVEVLLEMALSAEANEAVPPPPAPRLPEEWKTAKLKAAISRALSRCVRYQLGPFLNGMQRRLDRDLARVHEYYSGLREESWRKLQKQKADSARETLRLEAAAREYQAKVADLRQKYDLRVNLELSQTLELISPVQRAWLIIKRRKGERRLALDWNPLARQLDPLPCEWSYVAEGARVVCDDALHLVSLEGHAPCAQCGKEYCRACSPRRCPKCGKEDQPDSGADR